MFGINLHHKAERQEFSCERHRDQEEEDRHKEESKAANENSGLSDSISPIEYLRINFN